MIKFSLLIWKQFIFMIQIGPTNYYQTIGRYSEIWSYGLCLTNFIQLSSSYGNWIPLTPQGSYFMIQHFSMWHFTINMKSICLCISDRSCQFLPRHLDIFRNLKLCSLFDKLHTTFFKLLYSESHEHHKTLISWSNNLPCSRAFIRNCE